MALKGFERRLERMVEGTFARIFRSTIRPVELGRRLVREMDDNRSVDVRGRTLVPNHFTVELSEVDFEQYSEAIETNELRVLAQPEVDVTSFADGEPLVFTAEVEVTGLRAEATPMSSPEPRQTSART